MNDIQLAIADDHVLVRKGIISLMAATDKRFNFIIEAGNGKDLISQIEKSAEKPTICLLDICMPLLNSKRNGQKLKYWRCLCLKRTIILSG